MSSRFDDEAARLGPAIPPGRRLAVVGSTGFWGADSHELCHRLAVRLAAVPDLVAITGGMTGVGDTFGRSFADERRRLGLPEHLVHLLPARCGTREPGVTLVAGTDYWQRREILGRVGRVYLVIEGGPGTEHEVTVARGQGAAVVPVARSGGYARDVYPGLDRWPAADPADWQLLRDDAAALDVVASAVHRLVEAGFRGPD